MLNEVTLSDYIVNKMISFSSWLISSLEGFVYKLNLRKISEVRLPKIIVKMMTKFNERGDESDDIATNETRSDDD